MKNGLICLSLLLCVACSEDVPPPPAPKASENTPSPQAKPAKEVIYWVNSLKAPCVGVAPMQCLQVQTGEQLNSNGWQHFYSSIEGFAYEQGFIYKLKVREEDKPAQATPADASSKRYTLVQVLDKQLDNKLRLNDIWVLETIQGKPVTVNSQQNQPYLEMNVQEMRVMGNDSCNSFTGSIQTLDAEKLVFGMLATTRKMCMDMEIANQFHQQMNTVQGYVLDGLKLRLLDGEGNLVFGLQKTD